MNPVREFDVLIVVSSTSTSTETYDNARQQHFENTAVLSEYNIQCHLYSFKYTNIYVH